MKKFYLTLFMSLGLVLPLASADTIYLKNGKTVTGKIIVEDSAYLRVQVEGGALRTYYRGEIERHERSIPKALSSTGDTAEELTPRKRDLILRLLDANKARENMLRTFMKILQEAPEDKKAGLKEVLVVDEVIEQIIPIYAKHYKEEELVELINFYNSPTGSKHLDLTPIIVRETMDAVVQYFHQQAEDLIRDIPAGR